MNDIQIQTACCKIIADMGSYIVQIRKPFEVLHLLLLITIAFLINQIKKVNLHLRIYLSLSLYLLWLSEFKENQGKRLFWKEVALPHSSQRVATKCRNAVFLFCFVFELGKKTLADEENGGGHIS